MGGEGLWFLVPLPICPLLAGRVYGPCSQLYTTKPRTRVWTMSDKEEAQEIEEVEEVQVKQEPEAYKPYIYLYDDKPVQPVKQEQEPQQPVQVQAAQKELPLWLYVASSLFGSLVGRSVAEYFYFY